MVIPALGGLKKPVDAGASGVDAGCLVPTDTRLGDTRLGHDSRAILFHLETDRTTTLQAQLRRMLVSAILDGQIPAGSPLPSCRALAQSLKIARNTVVLAYQDLAEEGFLIAKERSGFFVNPEMVAAKPKESNGTVAAKADYVVADDAPDWLSRFKCRPTLQRNVVKPANWQDYPYPFIYGQIDQSLFPLAAWRECSRQALSVNSVREWANDRFAEDDPLLVEQIRTRLLPRRGVRVSAEEILVTVGAQQALYLLSALLFDQGTVFGIEDPGYTDARNIAALRTSRLRTEGACRGGDQREEHELTTVYAGRRFIVVGGGEFGLSLRQKIQGGIHAGAPTERDNRMGRSALAPNISLGTHGRELR